MTSAVTMQPLGMLEISVSLKFALADGIPPASIDYWARRVLGRFAQDDRPGEARLTAMPVGGAGASQALGFIDRSARLAIGLARVAGLPVFQHPRVIALTQAEMTGQWRAVVSFPSLDGVSAAQCGELLANAVRLAVRLSKTPPDDAHAEGLFAWVISDILPRFKHVLPVGKSTFPLLREAYAAGIPFIHLGRGVFQLGFGRRARRVDRSTTDGDSAIGSRLTHDKQVTASLLRQAGLPAPVHHVVRNLHEARRAAYSLGWPVVVKPTDTDRGEGVAVDIADEVRLESALKDALEISKSRRVLVERQVPGVCHRLFVADGRLLYAVKRLPMSVRGDGARSVSALVAAELALQETLPPWERSGLRQIDAEARAELSRNGLSEDSVPPVGLWVPLRRIESTAAGGVDEDVTERVHPENLRLALATTRLFGLQVAGIDILSEDLAVPWFSNGAIVNEVNYSPLLGGGEISRACIPEFLARIVDGDGRIPVELFVGGEAAWRRACERSQALRSEGIAAFATRAGLTLGPSGEVIPMASARNACRRARALALHRDVGAIVIAATPEESVAGRWPIEYVDRIEYVAED